MSFLPITLGVRRATDAQADQRLKTYMAAQGKFEQTARKILERDKHTCRYCGFRTTQYQRVHPKNWETFDLRPESMVTACIFCDQCFALEQVGVMGSGTLIYLPEMAQAALNHLARAVYVAEAGDDADLKSLAERALAALKSRQGEAKRRLGTDDPMILASAMFEYLSDTDYRNRAEKLEGLRLLPLPQRMVRGPRGEVDQFPMIRQSWLREGGPFAALPLAQWVQQFKDVTAHIGRA